MITVTPATTDIICVKESTLGWLKTSHRFVYYNLTNKTSYMHPNGNAVAVININPEQWQKMNDVEYNWVVWNYTSKLP